MPERKPTPWWGFFLDSFKDKINLILIGLLVVFVILAAIGQAGLSEPIGIAAVLVVIGVINTRTGLRVQKNTRDLKARTSRHYCTVIRNGLPERILSSSVVVGDLIVLQSGDKIVADGFLSDGVISVDNSVLNGESKPCHKTPAKEVPSPNQTITGETYIDSSSLFSGTTVLDGEGQMVVTRVGANTVNGKTILSVGEIEPPRTSLEIQLDHLASQISRFGYIAATIIAIAILASEVLRAGGISDGVWMLKTVLTALLSALSIVVAAVPEGLPVIIKLITAQNAKVMYRNNILAVNTKKIPEAGNLQLLCTDKTGTLTYGQLMQTALVCADGTAITGESPVLSKHQINVSVNNGALYDADGQVIGGNATDRALLAAIPESLWGRLTKENPVSKKISFNSAYKFSAVQIGECTYYKGAPERLIDRAVSYMDSSGQVQPIDKPTTLDLIRGFAERGMRVIATAYIDQPILADELPDGLMITSLVAIRDDVRAEVPAAVSSMQQAGVQVMMVTGDVLATAKAIAQDSGILNSEYDIAMNASDFDALSDTEALRKLRRIKVIARATPQTKLRIVQLAQTCGISVGMTGDGTNDAPALKAADVGFSMGSGTDVCKEAGDIIITDDNFVSITKAVLLGRTFMHNVLKFLKFQLPINFTLVFLSVFFPLLFGAEAVAPVQILLINIIMDSLNSLSFGGEPAKDEYMLEHPIPKGAPLLSAETIHQVALYTGMMIFLFALAASPSIRSLFPTDAQYESMRFALLIFAATLNGFHIRTDRCRLFEGLSRNPNFYRIAIGIFCGTFLAVQFGGDLLYCTPLNLMQWAAIIVLSILVLPIGMVGKLMEREG